MTERVLCVCAHPDDETLGCGGTLAKHSRAGDVVMVLALADGVSSRGSSAVMERRAMAEKAFKVLGVTQSGFGDWPDNQMDSRPLLAVVRDVEEAMGIFKPTIMYTHHSGDLNVDHRVVHDAVQVACRPQPGCGVKRLMLFEVPCSTAWGGGFTPQYFVDISATMAAKMEALQAYGDEMRPFPHPRSQSAIENLAAWRGASAGVAAAEAFVLSRQIC